MVFCFFNASQKPISSLVPVSVFGLLVIGKTVNDKSVNSFVLLDFYAELCTTIKGLLPNRNKNL